MANYKQEIPPNILKIQSNLLKIEILNENKGWNFAFKLQKLIYKYKPNRVVHIGIAGGKSNALIGKVFCIQRSFLRASDHIIESQKHRFADKINLNIPKANIVTKINKNAHSNKLYDFADIFDLETFRVGQLTNFFAIPIISVKGVSDTLIDLQNFEQRDEIEFLLNPDYKRTKKQKILDKINDSLKILHPQFEGIVKYFIDML